MLFWPRTREDTSKSLGCRKEACLGLLQFKDPQIAAPKEEGKIRKG